MKFSDMIYLSDVPESHMNEKEKYMEWLLKQRNKLIEQFKAMNLTVDETLSILNSTMKEIKKQKENEIKNFSDQIKL